MSTQLTFDNREVPFEESRRVARMGSTQSRMLRVLAQNPGMSSAEADRLGPGGARALRRLARRGLVVKHFGLWFVAKGAWE